MSMGLVALLWQPLFMSYPKLKTGFLPEMDEGTIVLDYFTPPGTSFQETDSVLMKAERLL